MTHRQEHKDRLERWLGRHNREMELLRTICSFVAAGTGILVFLKVFGLIP